MRELTVLDFGGGGLTFDSTGAFQPATAAARNCETPP